MFLLDFLKTPYVKSYIANDKLKNVQINIFIFITITGIIRGIQTANVFLLKHDILYLYYTLYILVVYASFLLIVYFKPKYLIQIIHLAIITTLIDLFNKTLIVQDFYITHFQIIFMMVVWSFYSLGRTYGLLYSLLYISVIFIFILLYGISFQIFPSQSNPAFYFTWLAFFCNNIIFIFFHYYYYNNLKKIIVTKRKTNKELISSLKNTTKFSHKVTGKLNDPLNSIIEISNRLLEKNYNEGNKKNLELLKFSSESLLEIINNIQSYHKISKKNKQDKPFDLGQLLNNIAATFVVKTSKKSIYFTFDYPEILNHTLVYSDKNRIMQILFNLLGNAIKFTPLGGKIEAIITELPSHAKDTISLRFSIQDSGIGIEQKKINDIFKPFKQADNSIMRKYGGTGLGLTIVQKALLSLNSEIKLTTEPNKGSTFAFDIEFKTITKQDSILGLAKN